MASGEVRRGAPGAEAEASALNPVGSVPPVPATGGSGAAWLRPRWLGTVQRIFVVAILAAAPVSAVAFHSLGPEVRPLEMQRRTERMLSERRDEARKPDQVIAALGLQPGQVVADIGSGPGYFALRFARAVAPEGKVYGVDIEPEFIDELANQARASGLTNVIPVLTTPDTSSLPPSCCDVAFFFSVYRHISDRVGYLRALRTRLKPGGRVAIVEWKKIATLRGGDRERPRLGPPEEEKINPEQVVTELHEAGFQVVGRPDFLEYFDFFIATGQP